MNVKPDGNDDAAQPEGDAEVARMQQHLRQDVTSWSKGRSEETERRMDGFAVPAAPPPAPRATRRVKAPVVAAPAVQAAEPAAKKPFSMSYAGTTSAQHIDRMIALRRG